MARTKDQAAAEQLGERFTALNTEAGSPAYDRIHLLIHAHVGNDLRVTPSKEWIRQAHTGVVDPWSGDLTYLDALCRFYNVEPAEAHDALGIRFAVIGREWSGGDRAFPDQLERRRSARSTKAKQRKHSGGHTAGDSDALREVTARHLQLLPMAG